MNFELRTIAAAAVLGIGLSGAAWAQSTPGGGTSGSNTSGGSAGAMQMSDAECQSVWSRMNPSSMASVGKSAAASYLKDFGTADTDSNDQLSSSEFMQACRSGNLSATASTGPGSGATGAGSGAAGSNKAK